MQNGFDEKTLFLQIGSDRHGGSRRVSIGAGEDGPVKSSRLREKEKRPLIQARGDSGEEGNHSPILSSQENFHEEDVHRGERELYWRYGKNV